MLFLGASGIVFIVFAESITGLFTHNSAVVRIASSCLRILSYGNIAFAYGMVMLQSFNGAGDTLTPTLVNFAGCWALEIPLAYWLAVPLGLHSNGVYFFDCDRASGHGDREHYSVPPRAMAAAENLGVRLLRRVNCVGEMWTIHPTRINLAYSRRTKVHANYQGF